MLGLEFVLRCHRICRNAENGGAGLGKISAQAGEIDRLLCATGCIGLWVEIEDKLAALEITQSNPAATVPAEGEGWSLRTRNKFAAHVAHVPSFRRFRAVNVAHAICVGGAQQVPYTCAGGCSGRLRARHRFTRALRQTKGCD